MAKTKTVEQPNTETVAEPATEPATETGPRFGLAGRVAMVAKEAKELHKIDPEILAIGQELKEVPYGTIVSVGTDGWDDTTLADFRKEIRDVGKLFELNLSVRYGVIGEANSPVVTIAKKKPRQPRGTRTPKETVTTEQ